MRQDIGDNIVQVRFAESGFACRANPEIDCTRIIELQKRSRRVLDTGLECDLMDWTKNGAIALGNGE
jgi:hypothetical protein